MKDHRRFHSPFQIRHFIIGAAGTPWGQYQQCLREIHARTSANQADHERCETLGIMNPNRADIELAMAERKKELDLFVEIATQLRETITKSVGELTAETVDRLDADLWMHRLRLSAANDIFRLGAVSSETISLMLSCPIKMRERLVEEIRNPEELKAFALTNDARPLIETS